ncbi:helix-turn-helix transcriptional regulator [Clostridium perfringens]|nr:helix-turn-helix transcriptional regulator [Clostridium perfringens]
MNKTEYLKQLISETGLKMKTFAEKADIPYTTLRSMLERGIENASVNNVIKVCRTLNISIETLYNMSREDLILSSEEENLLNKFNRLNSTGKNEAIKRVDELTEIPKYQKNNVTTLPKREKQIWEEPGKEYLMPIACHDDNLTDEEKDFMDEAIAEYERTHKK